MPKGLSMQFFDGWVDIYDYHMIYFSFLVFCSFGRGGRGEEEFELDMILFFGYFGRCERSMYSHLNLWMPILLFIGSNPFFGGGLVEGFLMSLL